MEGNARDVISWARQFRSIARYISALIFGGATILIALGMIPCDSNLVTPILISSGGQLLGASFVTGIKLRGFLTPEIRNIQGPKCDGYFTAASLVCPKCKTTLDIPQS